MYIETFTFVEIHSEGPYEHAAILRKAGVPPDDLLMQKFEENRKAKEPKILSLVIDTRSLTGDPITNFTLYFWQQLVLVVTIFLTVTLSVTGLLIVIRIAALPCSCL